LAFGYWPLAEPDQPFCRLGHSSQVERNSRSQIAEQRGQRNLDSGCQFFNGSKSNLLATVLNLADRAPGKAGGHRNVNLFQVSPFTLPLNASSKANTNIKICHASIIGINCLTYVRYTEHRINHLERPTMKSESYNALASLNRGFDLVLESLALLQQQDVS